MKDAQSILKNKIKEITKNKNNKSIYVNHEFQDYGLRIAHKLNDKKMKAYYIKIAKQLPRALIEDALAFSLTYTNVSKKGKLFMWKLHELIDKYKEKNPNFKPDLSRPKKKKKKSKIKKNSKSNNLEQKSLFKKNF